MGLFAFTHISLLEFKDPVLKSEISKFDYKAGIGATIYALSWYPETVPLNEPSGHLYLCDVTTKQSPPTAMHGPPEPTVQPPATAVAVCTSCCHGHDVTGTPCRKSLKIGHI